MKMGRRFSFSDSGHPFAESTGPNPLLKQQRMPSFRPEWEFGGVGESDNSMDGPRFHLNTCGFSHPGHNETWFQQILSDFFTFVPLQGVGAVVQSLFLEALV